MNYELLSPGNSSLKLHIFRPLIARVNEETVTSYLYLLLHFVILFPLYKGLTKQFRSAQAHIHHGLTRQGTWSSCELCTSLRIALHCGLLVPERVMYLGQDGAAGPVEFSCLSLVGLRGLLNESISSLRLYHIIAESE